MHTPVSSAAHSSPAGGAIRLTAWQWKLCGFLLLATALSYLDRQALSVVAPIVAGELRLDNERLGRLLSAFFYAYAPMHIPIGWILDRYNIRITYGLFVALWSCPQILAGAARGFGQLFACRLLLGAFETAGQTGAARIIARAMPPRERTFANGLMMSGGSIGAILAPVLMIFLANRFGWRFGFVVLGLLGLVWTAAWLAWFRPGPAILRGAPPAAAPVEADRLGVLLRNRKFWACTAGAAFTIPIIHISSAWMPTYFVQEWGLKVSGTLSGYLFLVYAGLDIGFIGGGAAVSWLISRGWSVARARVRMMWVSALVMLSIALVPFAPGVGFAIASIFLLNLGRACWGALFLAFNQDIAPGRVGLVAGVMGCIGSFMGALFVWLIGWITRSHGFAGPFWMIAGHPGTGMRALDQDGALLPAVIEIIRRIARSGAVLGTGHLSAEETAAVVAAARLEGVRAILITHPEINFIAMPPEWQRKLSGPGLYFERCFCRAGFHRDWAGLAADIRAVGVGSSVLATDLGQPENLHPVEGFAYFLEQMMHQGFSASELERMTAANPAVVLGLE